MPCHSPSPLMLKSCDDETLLNEPWYPFCFASWADAQFIQHPCSKSLLDLLQKTFHSWLLTFLRSVFHWKWLKSSALGYGMCYIIALAVYLWWSLKIPSFLCYDNCWSPRSWKPTQNLKQGIYNMIFTVSLSLQSTASNVPDYLLVHKPTQWCFSGTKRCKRCGEHYQQTHGPVTVW